MKQFRKLLSTFLAIAMMFGIFAGSGLSANAAETVEVEVSYVYVEASGNNKIVVDTEYVAEGTLWKDFFESYVPCFEDGTISDGHSGNVWEEVYIQNWGTTLDDIETSYHYNKEIKNFNQYADSAYVTFYGYPTDYKHGNYSFEVIKDGEHYDSGTGWDLLIPSSYTYGSKEAIAYAEENIGIHSYITDYLNMPGATYTIETPFGGEEGRWDSYVFSIVASSTVSGNDIHINLDRYQEESENEGVPVVQEPQTPENNYVVFHESVAKMIDDAIAANVGSDNANTGSLIIETNVWISFNKHVYQKLQDSGMPIQITFRYKGDRYQVNIPAKADLMSLVDENGFCGFLNLMANFGGIKL